MSDEDLLERIKQNLKEFGGIDVSDSEVQQFISEVRAKVPRLLLSKPRRGIHTEYERFLPRRITDMLAKQAAKTGVQFQRCDVQPRGEALEQLIDRVERWRELECLTAAPHSFESLRHLPELQQLIAFTAVGVLSYVGASSTNQAAVVSDILTEHQQRAGSAPPSSMQEVLRAAPHSAYFEQLQGACVDSSCLLHRCSPHLCLALAAEVAAGLLCQGQPAPPDTPEHGSALKLFVRSAHLQLRKEVLRDKSLAKPPCISSSRGRAPCTSKLQQLWAHTGTARQQDQQQHSDAGSSSPSSLSSSAVAAAALLPPPGKVRSWPLSPHIDLQLQLPAPHLLKLVVLAAAKQAAMPLDLTDQPHGSDALTRSSQQQQQQRDPVLSRLLQLLQESEQEASQRQEECAAPTQLQALVMLLDSSVLEALSSGCSIPQEAASTHDSGCSTSLRSSLGERHSQPHPAVVPNAAPGPTQPPPAVSAAAPTGGAPAGVQPTQPTAAAEAAGQCGDQLPRALCALAAKLTARCLAEHVALDCHQALPLQALQLLTAVRQLEVTAQAACAEGAAAAAHQDQTAAAATAAKQQLVHQALLLLQHVQDMQASMPHARQAAAGATRAGAGAAQAEGGAAHSSKGMLPPSEFFAGNGPLSDASGGQALGLGLWEGARPGATRGDQQHTTGGCSITSGRGGHDANGSSSSRGGSSAHREPIFAAPKAQQEIQEEQLVAQHLLQASMLSCKLQAQVAGQLTGLINQLAADGETMQVEVLHRQVQYETEASQLDKLQLYEYQWALRAHGLRQVSAHDLLQPWRFHRHLAAALIQLRAVLCAAHGLPAYDAAAWQAMACRGALRPFALDADADSTHLKRQWHSDGHNDSDSSSSESESDDEWDAEAVVDAGSAAGSRQGLGSPAGWSSASDSSSSSRVRQSFEFHVIGRLAQALMQRFQQQLDAVKPRTVQQQTRRQHQEVVTRGAAATSDMAHAVAARMAPLQQWHHHQDQRQQQAALRAMEWWNSKQRVAAAVAGATGKAQPMQAAAGQEAAGSTGSTPGSSGSNKVWVSGQHDHHPQCPLCQEERHQEQQHQKQQHAADACENSSTSSSASSSPPYASWPVSYDDPFLWRRLLWRLLGKLSPEAQAFYAKYLAMCTHCCSKSAWDMVLTSVERCVWSPPEVDLFDCVLFRIERPRGGRQLIWIRQHSRAINSAYQQGYHPSMTLLSKQVLLALSPLHHQVLPPPEVAHCLPSSFMPAVGKALMQQLCEVPVLDGFEHERCRLQLWHVWWHVGLRRYHWVQQRQQQLQQLQQAAVSSGSSGSECGSTWDNGMTDERLYRDADARLYAVGFATRQLTGRPATPTAGGSLAHANTTLVRSIRSALYTRVMLQLCNPELRQRMVEQRGEAGLRYFELLQHLLSKQFVQPGVIPHAMPLLSQSACAPDDPLVPLQQQHGAGRRRSTHWRITEHMSMPGVQAYLQFGCPDRWQQHEAELQQELMQDSTAQAEDPSTQPALSPQQHAGPSDMSALMMVDPVPPECLQGPEVWWAWHQQLLGLERCDVCDKQVQQVVGCPACHCTVYCSAACQKDDRQHHLICSKLAEAHKRYQPHTRQTTTSSSSRSRTIPPQLCMPQPCGQKTCCSAGLPTLTGLPILTSLLQPSAYEAGPLGHTGTAGFHMDWPKDSFAPLDEILAALRHGLVDSMRL